MNHLDVQPHHDQPSDPPPPVHRLQLPDAHSVVLFTFGHRFGRPGELLVSLSDSNAVSTPSADLLIDARSLSNPPRHLRKDNTGLTPSFRSILFADPEREAFYTATLQTVRSFLNSISSTASSTTDPVYIGVGCQRGKHRSVALVERLAKDLSLELDKWHFQVLHRDINRKKIKDTSTESLSIPSTPGSTYSDSPSPTSGFL